ncbi:hypothetical protein [Thioclava sp. GXIMD2076]|uniref:hypothetical protein n=1 Tax=Thioclava sp. GXIMD2076 TaxID=3131931 RepID=UPI0030CE003A
MKTRNKNVLLGSTSTALVAAVFGSAAPANVGLGLGRHESSRIILMRMLRVMFPHPSFSDAPYERCAKALIDDARQTPGQKISFAAALDNLADEGFADLGDDAALTYLRGIEKTGFFQLVRAKAVVTLYDDEEVWQALGYEGASFDQGGYIHRGFNDLDWLPEPRIEEYDGQEGAQP